MLDQFELKRLWHYDPEAGLFTRLVATGNGKVGDVAGCRDHYGYIVIGIAGKLYKAHRLAFLYIIGAFPTSEVDHINSVRNDNRWINLRDATRSVNCQNLRKPPANNTSGYLGVAWHKQSKKWHAKIMVNSKQISLGLFDDACEAGAHYLRKKREFHEGNTL